MPRAIKIRTICANEDCETEFSYYATPGSAPSRYDPGDGIELEEDECPACGLAVSYGEAERELMERDVSAYEDAHRFSREDEMGW